MSVSPPRLILGPRRCGKSAMVERALHSMKQKAYFGTLWSDYDTRDTIARHAFRRGTSWLLAESVGTVDGDLERLSGLTSTMAIGAPVMIDGLSTWLFHLSGRSWRKAPGAAIDLALLIAAVINARPDLSWWLLDVPPQTLRAEGNRVAMIAANRLHAHLRLYLPDMIITEVPEELPT